jgi:hypothetical protein
MDDQAHINMYRKDAATFRSLLDSLFHNCPMNAAGLLEPNDHAKKVWRALSEHTYRGGKIKVKEDRDFLQAMDAVPRLNTE